MGDDRYVCRRRKLRPRGSVKNQSEPIICVFRFLGRPALALGWAALIEWGCTSPSINSFFLPVPVCGHFVSKEIVPCCPWEQLHRGVVEARCPPPSSPVPAHPTCGTPGTGSARLLQLGGQSGLQGCPKAFAVLCTNQTQMPLLCTLVRLSFPRWW